MAETSYTLADGLEAACRGAITEVLDGTRVPPVSSAHLDAAAKFIACAEIVTAIVNGDDIARDSVGRM